MLVEAAVVAEIPVRVWAEPVVAVMVVGLIQALAAPPAQHILAAAVAVGLIRQRHPAQAAMAL